MVAYSELAIRYVSLPALLRFMASNSFVQTFLGPALAPGLESSRWSATCNILSNRS